MIDFLLIIAAIWGVCFLAAVVMFGLDERAHRRRLAAAPASEDVRIPMPSAHVAPARRIESAQTA